LLKTLAAAVDTSTELHTAATARAVTIFVLTSRSLPGRVDTFPLGQSD
jgi:hypothetical protein